MSRGWGLQDRFFEPRSSVPGFSSTKSDRAVRYLTQCSASGPWIVCLLWTLRRRFINTRPSNRYCNWRNQQLYLGHGSLRLHAEQIVGELSSFFLARGRSSSIALIIHDEWRYWVVQRPEAKRGKLELCTPRCWTLQILISRPDTGEHQPQLRDSSACISFEKVEFDLKH